MRKPEFTIVISNRDAEKCKDATHVCLQNPLDLVPCKTLNWQVLKLATWFTLIRMSAKIWKMPKLSKLVFLEGDYKE